MMMAKAVIPNFLFGISSDMDFLKSLISRYHQITKSAHYQIRC